jgi:nucleotide-binding universal stress UspA family protein
LARIVNTWIDESPMWREHDMSDYRTILVPYDFSAHAEAALGVAADLGRRLGSDLHLVHVIQPPAYAYAYGTYGGAATPPIDMREVSEGARKSLRNVADSIEADVPVSVEPHVVEGSGIADMLRESADELGADLIVMGTHGRTGLAHVFLGSVAERTLRRAGCPVLTVQAAEGQAEKAASTG